MAFTIGQAAKCMGVSVPTLRYYDQEGLLPFLRKGPNGLRVFEERDIEWLAVINCMKQAGTPIKEIKRYIDMCMEGDDTLQERLDVFRRRKEEVLRQMSELHDLMKTIDHKIWYYETALAAGTESVHEERCYTTEELLRG
jgi:Predicted transcriptional regulators